MQYLTFDEYVEIGGVLELAAFDRFLIRASSRITQETHGRIKKMQNVPVEVKHLCRDLIEYMYNNLGMEKSLSGTSQAQGGTSESESYVAKTIKDKENDIESIIYDYLATVTDDNKVPLLYRGAL